MTDAGDFWSRRRAGVLAEEQAEHTADAERAVEADQARLEEMDDAAILAELDLPDPDALQPGDNIRGFMTGVVPERLRRRALRQLWKLNPVLANLDGLVDYGEDYTDAATVPELLKTAYQVGRGMLAHVEELARQAEAADADPAPAAAENTAPALDEAPDEVPDLPPDPLPDATVTATNTTDAAPTADAAPAAPVPAAVVAPQPPAPAPRRMRFAFQG